ncbi:MAG: DUF4202 domain-containing protein [Leptospirales bacterium]|nr:DUF4202 domain-containing protein [Leptospirales bacterium]
MTVDARLNAAIEKFDALNAQDPRKVPFDGKEVGTELLYSWRMTERLKLFAPNASTAVQLAVRSQHICRWQKPRESYPEGRTGYLKWRTDLGKMHAEIAASVLTECGFDTETIENVTSLLRKMGLKTNPETQLLEDVICLVFIEYYLSDFMKKHAGEPEKIEDIVKKTLRKMSPAAIEAAPKLNLSTDVVDLWKKLSA